MNVLLLPKTPAPETTTRLQSVRQGNLNELRFSCVKMAKRAMAALSGRWMSAVRHSLTQSAFILFFCPRYSA